MQAGVVQTCPGSAESWKGSFAAASPARVYGEGEGGSKWTPAGSSMAVSPGFPGLCYLDLTVSNKRALQKVVCCSCCEVSMISSRPWLHFGLDSWQPLLHSWRSITQMSSGATSASGILASKTSMAVAGTPACSVLDSESFWWRDPKVEILKCLAAFWWDYQTHLSLKTALLALEM